MLHFLFLRRKWLPIVKALLVLSVILLCTVNISQAQDAVIIPKPLEILISKDNAVFVFNKKISIVTDREFLSDAKILAAYLKGITGFAISIKGKTDQYSSANVISLKRTINDSIPNEGYIMDVSDKKIEIQASHSAGVYYGCMSLLQAIENDKNLNKFTVAYMHIKDQPRFAWRGLMLDCSRTFISLDYLKKTVDRMSFYKLNILHLHLTDDQGWRLQIKKYPLLTRKGAFFAAKYNEPKEFQGYYTQAQMKDLVNYALQRHITVVPEIECPGHSHAALYAYPKFSCSGKVSPIYPFFAGPSVTTSVFCPSNKKVYIFFKDIIKEVAEIFPSSFIHLGGDEVPENAWNDCKDCQAMMDSLNIKDQRHLQGYMMNRVGSDVLSVNKRPIGWDEVFAEGVGKRWIIMVWRGKGRGLEEVKAGHDVILCPTSNLYFNYDYRLTPTKKVYSFEPIPDGITVSEEKHYLGIEACFWSHIDRTETRIDYQLYPRVLALAERAWSPESVTDYNEFYNRELKNEFWLNFFDIKYKRMDE